MNISNRCARLALGAAMVVALAACGSVPPATLLILPPVAPGPAAAAPPVAATRVLAVRRLEMPEYLVARRVRYRADDSTLAEWPDTYWAERIEVGVAREFAAALRERLPDWRLCEGNCSEQSPAMALQLRLTRMDYVRGARRLQASVQVELWSTERQPRLIRGEERSYEIAGDGDTPQSQARTITQLLARVAGDVSLAMAAVP